MTKKNHNTEPDQAAHTEKREPVYKEAPAWMRGKENTAMNLPNMLSMFRMFLVPVFVAVLIFTRDMYVYGVLLAAILYALASITDMLDGHIARKYRLITDFGKFIDPLADKCMVLSSFAALTVYLLLKDEKTEAIVLLFVYMIVLIRELGVTGLRLVVAGKKIVVAASWLGKIKTVSQMVGTLIIMLEPYIFKFSEKSHIVAYICMGIIAVTTLVSGIDYLRAYAPYIDSNR